ncbi:hypothetical protein DFP72DRAFT_831616, partial [Ephemerocybe angulata]
ATKAAKRKFFDARIKEVAETNKHPWDLMAWVKERKNPPCKAIQFNGQPCHELSDLWDALHNTYNATSDRVVDVSILNKLPQEPVHDWHEFSVLELTQALQVCSACSALGPTVHWLGNHSWFASSLIGCFHTLVRAGQVTRAWFHCGKKPRT